jgi:hypothetical protein
MDTHRLHSRKIAALTLVALAGCSAPGSGASVWTMRTMTAAPATRPPTPSDSAASTSEFSYATVVATITAQGYNVNSGPVREGSPGPLRAFEVVCTGSADGNCGAIKFFYQNRYVGSIYQRVLGTSIVAASNSRIASQNGRRIVVRYQVSKPTDPVCCPSGPFFTVTYGWNGKSVVATGGPTADAPQLTAQPHP